MAKKKGQHPMCQKPDRHVPGIVCGYPFPCPHHTIILEEKEIKDGPTLKRAVALKTALKSAKLIGELLPTKNRR